jgi:hypothetical protein
MDAVTATPARRSRRELWGRAGADRPWDRRSAGAPRSPAGGPLRVAMLAPPWIPVPALRRLSATADLGPRGVPHGIASPGMGLRCPAAPPDDTPPPASRMHRGRG